MVPYELQRKQNIKERTQKFKEVFDQKDSLFDAHNFDIEIDVDTALIGKNFQLLVMLHSGPFSLQHDFLL